MSINRITIIHTNTLNTLWQKHSRNHKSPPHRRENPRSAKSRRRRFSITLRNWLTSTPRTLSRCLASASWSWKRPSRQMAMQFGAQERPDYHGSRQARREIPRRQSRQRSYPEEVIQFSSSVRHSDALRVPFLFDNDASNCDQLSGRGSRFIGIPCALIHLTHFWKSALEFLRLTSDPVLRENCRRRMRRGRKLLRRETRPGRAGGAFSVALRLRDRSAQRCADSQSPRRFSGPAPMRQNARGNRAQRSCDHWLENDGQRSVSALLPPLVIRRRPFSLCKTDLATRSSLRACFPRNRLWAAFVLFA